MASLSEVPCASCVRRTCCCPADLLLACIAGYSWGQIGFGEVEVCVGNTTFQQEDDATAQQSVWRRILVWQHFVGVGVYVHLAVWRQEGRASPRISI